MRIITKEQELKPLLDLIDEHKTVALDLEFVPERTYYPVLCLVQCCIKGEAFIVDPFKVEDLSELWQRVCDQSVKSIFHAASQDLLIIFQQSNLMPKNIFDTQVAAGFAGWGYSAGYRKLLQEVLGVFIPKTESFSDWQARPLTDSQLEYAINDVIHLEPLADDIESSLKKLGRLEWAMEECLSYESEDYYKPDRSREFFRIKGSNKLKGRALAILRELWTFRDQEARTLNKPPRLVLSDNALLEISRRQSKTIKELTKLRGIRSDQVHKYASEIAICVDDGLAIPQSECPSLPSGKPPIRSEVLSGDFIYLLLKNFADELNLATEHLSTRDEIMSLIRAKPQSLDGEIEGIRLTRGWRRKVVGEKIIKVIEGAPVQLNIDNNSNSPRNLEIDIEGI